MADQNDISELLGLLDWYREMGADAALDAGPIDWLARGPVPPGHGFAWPERELERGPDRAPALTAIDTRAQYGRHISSAAPTAPAQPPADGPRLDARPRPQTPLAPSEADTDARRITRTVHSLDALEAALNAFDGCTLKATASKLCFYRGAPTARVMIIGEAPGRDEDIEGKPFAGRAGQLLDRMLASIGLSNDDVHITNVVYWRPPGNRAATPQEALACRPFLDRQIELVQPDVIVALGGAAAKDIMGAPESIMRLRGKWREVTIGGASIPALATLHPDYLLRTPAAKQLAWIDLLAIKTRLAQP